MKVVIGSDHAGFRLKEELKKALAEWKHEVVDVGTHSTDSVDYPDFAKAACDEVLALGGTPSSTLGVLVCGSGIGISIAANKVHGIRAARCEEPYSARMSREHNDANVLCMGERVIGTGVALDTLKAFLDGKFAGGKHQTRIEKIAKLEDER
jgi:ribose 5-phosphate isomerase B